jgi:hypothetical protein
MNANALIEGSPLPLRLAKIEAFGTHPDQRLTVDDWSLEYHDARPAVGALEGTIDFHVDGQHFDWVGQFMFLRGGDLSEDVSCAH